jgi:tRNA (cmo5U34)-methyltransferase
MTMSRTPTVGQGIVAENSGWSFDAAAGVFDDHVRQSIPLYDEGHRLIARLSDFFLYDGAVVYEIGPSTGTLAKLIAERHPTRRFRYVGLDISEPMVERARAKVAGDKRFEMVQADALTYDYDPCAMFISYYTVQFVAPRVRQVLINRIAESLEWGGAFLFFEKVRGADARFQDIITGLYTEFKIENGFSSDEIVNKTRSLKGVMEPFSSAGNAGLIERAGFKDWMPIMRWACFEGVLCIK